MSLYDDIQNSIKLALVWLKEQQNINISPDIDGSWGRNPTPGKRYIYPIGTTGLVLIKFETYAIEMGLPSPFDDRYIYKDVVERGLDYLFKQAKQDSQGHGIYFVQDFSGTGSLLPYEINYSTGIALAAICANQQYNKVINSTNPVVNGQTYKEVAQQIVDYLSWSQNDTYGGWEYYKGINNCPDNSISGYVVLGLDYATSDEFKFKCILNPAYNVIGKLKNWIGIIQNPDGGSKYSICGQPVVPNILKTGNLLEEMHFCGYPIDDIHVQKAMSYIANKWNEISCKNQCAGWNGNPVGTKPADYQATFTTMKGLSQYDVKTIVNSSGQSINWYDEMARVIVDQQNLDGSWDFSGEDDPSINAEPILSTAWAVLKLERAVPLQCNGKLSITKEGCKCIACIGEKIPYIIKLKNEGPGTCYRIIVTDTIPIGAYVSSFKVTKGDILQSNANIVWSIPQLDAGETVSAMIVVVATENICFDNKGYMINTCEVTSCSGMIVKNVNDTAITNIDCFNCECCKNK